jgi:geranylgeranyl diphosphate synthase, type I
MPSTDAPSTGGLWSLPAREIERLEEFMRGLCSGAEQLDPAGALACDHLASGGKRVRARLAVAAARALGARHDVMPWAAACELLHNASLVHDDIQDGDSLRRGRPSVWALHGTSVAVSVGDLMLMLPWSALELLSCDEAIRWRLARALASRAQAAARAQAVDIEINMALDTDWWLWRRAAEGKTGELLALPVEGAALLAGFPAAESRALGDVFRGLGLAYQLCDDLEDFQALARGDSRVDCDFRSGRINGVILEHLRLWPDDRDWLIGMVRARGRADLAPLVTRLAQCGVVEAILDRVAALTAKVRASALLRRSPALQALAVELAGAIDPDSGETSERGYVSFCFGLP